MGFALPARLGRAEGCAAPPLPRLPLAPPGSPGGGITPAPRQPGSRGCERGGDTKLWGSGRRLGFGQSGRIGFPLWKRIFAAAAAPSEGAGVAAGTRRPLALAMGGRRIPARGIGAEPRNAGWCPQPGKPQPDKSQPDKSSPSPAAELPAAGGSHRDPCPARLGHEPRRACRSCASPLTRINHRPPHQAPPAAGGGAASEAPPPGPLAAEGRGWRCRPRWPHPRDGDTGQRLLPLDHCQSGPLCSGDPHQGCRAASRRRWAKPPRAGDGTQGCSSSPAGL